MLSHHSINHLIISLTFITFCCVPFRRTFWEPK